MICPMCWGSRTYPVEGASCPTCHGAGVFPDLQLTEHFMLSEFLKSETAVRQSIANDPSAKIIAHLQQLCVQLIEPIRGVAGPLKVSSGYRADKLNTFIGSHPSSAHPWGWAADINSHSTRKELVDEIISLKIPFDQIIFEGTWVHVGLFKPDTGAQRKEVLSTFNGGKTYVPYDPNDSRIHT